MIHLVYSVPLASQRGWRFVERRYRRLLARFPRLYAPWRRGLHRRGKGVMPAPGSITRNLYQFLSARCQVRLYDLSERTPLDYGRNDIILGHPWPDPQSVMQQALRNGRACRLKVLIFPIHHAMPHINAYAQPLVEKADVVFGIMGPYWYDTLPASPFAAWQSKIVRLDMAVDPMEYPLVKTRFNPPGHRGFLYIGSNRPEKGCGVLDATLAGMPEARRGWIGSGPELAHVPRIAAHAELNPDYVASLAHEYDIFVNTSLSDANPTTILEAMAWGFPVACTPESGYYRMPTISSLSATDIAGNIRTLSRLQAAPEASLQQTAGANRALVLENYTWTRFCDTVWNVLKNFV